MPDRISILISYTYVERNEKGSIVTYEPKLITYNSLTLSEVANMVKSLHREPRVQSLEVFQLKPLTFEGIDP